MRIGDVTWCLVGALVAAGCGGDDKKTCKPEEKRLVLSELEVSTLDPAGHALYTLRDLRYLGSGYLAAFAGKNGAAWKAGLLRVDGTAGTVEALAYDVYSDPAMSGADYVGPEPRADIVLADGAAVGYVIYPQLQPGGVMVLAAGVIVSQGGFSRGAEMPAFLNTKDDPPVSRASELKENTRIAQGGGGAVAVWLADASPRALFGATIKKMGGTLSSAPLQGGPLEGNFQGERSFDLVGVPGGALLALVLDNRAGNTYDITIRKLDLAAGAFGPGAVVTSLPRVSGAPDVMFVRSATTPALYYFVPSQRSHKVLALSNDGAPAGEAVDLGERSAAATVLAPPVTLAGGYVLAERTTMGVSATLFGAGAPQSTLVYPAAMGLVAAKDAFVLAGEGKLAIAGLAAAGGMQKLGLAEVAAKLDCPAAAGAAGTAGGSGGGGAGGSSGR
jgi:hypothetical protein